MLLNVGFIALLNSVEGIVEKRHIYALKTKWGVKHAIVRGILYSWKKYEYFQQSRNNVQFQSGLCMLFNYSNISKIY